MLWGGEEWGIQSVEPAPLSLHTDRPGPENQVDENGVPLLPCELCGPMTFYVPLEESGRTLYHADPSKGQIKISKGSIAVFDARRWLHGASGRRLDRDPQVTLVGHIESRLLPEMVDDEYEREIDMDSNNEEGGTNSSDEDKENATEEG
jgi:hypothetical protein